MSVNRIYFSKRSYLASLVMALGTLYVGEVKADPENKCLIKIDGVVYDSNPCLMNLESGGIVQFGKDVNASGYWAYLIKRDDGSYDGYWNGEVGAMHAHYSLGRMTKTGDCWVNDRAVLCRK